MFGTIAWIVAVVLGVIGLTIALIHNAKALRRDVNERRDAFRASLESEANAMLDGILRANKFEETGSRPPTTPH